MITPGKGVRLAIDVGTVRIGVARSDQDQIMALPVTTVTVSNQVVREIIEIIYEIDPKVIYVGKPISLKSGQTKSTQMSIDFANELAGELAKDQNHTGVQIRLLDERLTTVSAQSQLHASGKSTKQGKNVIDQVAAIVLLDHAMSIEKSMGTLAGEEVSAKDPG